MMQSDAVRAIRNVGLSYHVELRRFRTVVWYYGILWAGKDGRQHDILECWCWVGVESGRERGEEAGGQ